MKAHIVGGGFGGLAAAALLIRNTDVPGADITIYEADDVLGGGFFLSGSAANGYNLPGSVFDKEFRCTFDLLKSIPSARNPSISVTEDFFAFNTGEPYQDKAHILDRDGRIVHGPRFGLSLGDGLSLARVVLTPEAMLDGRRIEEFFSRQFFLTEFWFLWSTLMGSPAQRDRVSTLHESLPVLVPGPVRHEGRDAHARQSAPIFYRTAGRVAAPTRRELPHRHLRAGHRLRGGARPHHRQSARL